MQVITNWCENKNWYENKSRVTSPGSNKLEIYTSRFEQMTIIPFLLLHSNWIIVFRLLLCWISNRPSWRSKPFHSTSKPSNSNSWWPYSFPPLFFIDIFIFLNSLAIFVNLWEIIVFFDFIYGYFSGAVLL